MRDVTRTAPPARKRMRRRPLKVLQVSYRYIPEFGGIETHIYEMTSRLAASGTFDISVAATDRRNELPRYDGSGPLPILRCRAWPAKRDYYFAPGMARIVERGDWDLMHMQGVHTLVPPICLAAARRAGIPYVVTFHTGGTGPPLRQSLRGLQWRALAPLLRGAAELIAVSHFEQRLFSSILGLPLDQISLIPNGGTLPAPTPTVDPVPGRIVSCGRLERYKGHHRAIEALPLVKQMVPDAQVHIFGGGAYEPELRRLARELGVEDDVLIRLVPTEDRQEMADNLAAASVMAALSDYEAHPVGIMEALGLGLPVVGSDVAGTHDLVAEGLVAGVPVRATAAEIAEALVRGMNSPRMVPVLPTWDEAAAALERRYLRAVERSGTSKTVSLDSWTRNPASGGRQRTQRLHVVHVITSLGTGGAERHIQQLVSRSSDDTSVVCLYGGGLIADEIKTLGVPVYLLGMAGVSKATTPLRLARLLRSLAPDVVNVHLLAGQLWGIPAARLARVPVIVSTEQSLLEETIEGRNHNLGLRVLYRSLERLTDHTVAVSETTRRRLRSWNIPDHRITVIENAVDIEAASFSSMRRVKGRRDLGLAEDAVVIGAVGRLEPVKRFDLLLRAVGPLLHGYDAHLVIVGEGSLHGDLAGLVRDLGLVGRAHLVGGRSDAANLLSSFDLFVSTSEDETFGIAVVEAVVNGLPTIFARCPGLDDLEERPEGIVKMRSGVIDEVAELRNTIAAHLKERERYRTPTAVQARYEPTRVAAAYESVFRRLLDEKSNATVGTAGPTSRSWLGRNLLTRVR